MKKIGAVVLSIMMLSGCATHNGNVFSPPDLSKYVIKPPADMDNNQNQDKKKATKGQKSVSIEYIPTSYGEHISWSGNKIDKTTPSMPSENGSLKISVENMPLDEFVRLVFGKILKSNYFIGKKIKGKKDKITLKMTTPLTKNMFLNVITTVLNKYNVNIRDVDVGKGGRVYFIDYGSSHNNKKPELKYFIGRDIPDMPNTENICAIVPLYYINGRNYTSMIKRFSLSSHGLAIAFKKNVIMISDTAQNIKNALSLIKLFDRSAFAAKRAALIKLRYISPRDFLEEVKNALPYEGIPIANSVNDSGVLLKAIKSLSSVLVVSPKKEWINIVYFWKKKLDSVSALGNKKRLFVYYPKNRRADELAKVFSNISKNISISQSAKKSTNNNSVSVPGDVKVVVDDSRNALVILCTPAEYENVKTTLNKLDTLPKQVFVQVSILEVTLAGKLDYGLEWYLKHSGKFNGVLQTAGGLGLGNGGLNYSIVKDTMKFMAMINAFAQKKLINVLSSPSLVVLDNKEASINVGTEVPVVTSESTNNNIQDNGTTALVRTIQYRNTGVILNIKPTINSNGIVTMTISQEVSDAQTNDISPGIDSPLILTRNIKTSVTLKSGTTLLLGGLIKKSRSNTINKVPVLGDVPAAGNLFKNTAKGEAKTELIVEITPYILPNVDTAKKITKSYKELMDLFNSG